MITQDLIAYIRQQIGAGILRSTIEQTLLAKGWHEQDIAEAFSVVQNSQVQPSTTPPATPTTPSTTPASSMPPIAQKPSQIPEIKTSAQNFVMADKPRGHFWVWALVIVLLLLAGGAFAAYESGLFSLFGLAPISSVGNSPISPTDDSRNFSPNIVATSSQTSNPQASTTMPIQGLSNPATSSMSSSTSMTPLKHATSSTTLPPGPIKK